MTSPPPDNARARIAVLWALALYRFRLYVEARRGTDMSDQEPTTPRPLDTTGLRRAYAAYYARRFNVELDPEREIVVTLGSKEGFANLAQAITAPGDRITAPARRWPANAASRGVAPLRRAAR